MTQGPVLAVDASGARPTVALLGPDGEPWGSWCQTAGRRGTAELAVAVASLLDDRRLAVSDLAGLAVGIGPGSYTGLRASIAFVRGLAHPGGLPIAAVVSTEASARGVLREHAEAREVVVLLDARREECYRADYRREGDEAVETAPPRLVPHAEAESLETRESIFVVREPDPDGYDVAALGGRRLDAGGDAPATVLPLYLKRSHAEIALEERARRR